MILIGWILFLLAPRVEAIDQKTAKLSLIKSENPIESLTWKSGTVPIRTRKLIEDNKVEVYAIIEGYYPKLDWVLTWNGRTVIRSPKGKFSIHFLMQNPQQTIDLLAISPYGKVEAQRMLITIETFREFVDEVSPIQRHSLTPGAGFTYILFSDSRISNITQTAITAKLAYRYQLTPNLWDLGASMYFTAIPITANVAESLRFFGLNFRAGYRFQFVEEPWSFSLHGGTYFTTMLISSGRYGFRNLSGPQLFPSLKKTFRSGNSASFYLKYAPVSSGFALLGIGNREVAFGSSYTYLLENGAPLTFNLDLSNLRIQTPATTIQVNTATLGLSQTF